MNTIDKINELIDNTYTIEIKSYTDVHLDDYEDGELEYRNGWANDTTTFHTESENLTEEVSSHLFTYLDDTLFLEYKKEHLIDSLNSGDEETCFWMSNFVDNDNTTPSESQVEEWKDKKIELFVQSISISISVNGTELPACLILEILNNETPSETKSV